MTKDELEQDNDTWSTLGLHALRLTERLEEKRPEDERETKPTETADRKREHERFVETRLREIDRFERRYRNNGA